MRLGRSCLAAAPLLLGMAVLAAQESGRLPFGAWQRVSNTPVIAPRGKSWEAAGTFNPAVAMRGDKIVMLYRAQDKLGTSRLGYAESADGIHFSRRNEPVMSPSEDYEKNGGVEDPRLVQFDDTYYVTYTGYNKKDAQLCLATSKDLVHWERKGIIIPANRGNWNVKWTKSGAIAPEKIGGKYWMYFLGTSADNKDQAGLASSTDLLHWTEATQAPVLPVRPGRFDSRVAEPGPAPIVTADEIILIYNGADDKLVYRTGIAIFDRNDPRKLLWRSDDPIFSPEKDWEKVGEVPNVVFVEGVVLQRNRYLFYYGGADKFVGVAEAPIKRSPINRSQSIVKEGELDPLPTTPLTSSGPMQVQIFSTVAFDSIRRLLGCGLFLLGSPLYAQQPKPPAPPPAPIANFTDIAEKAGLTAQNVFGGLDTKKYIIETTGTGVAIFDYDNDGWPDIFLVNGTKLEGFPVGQGPSNHLYRNNHDGTFTDVTVRAGLAATGWGQGVCVGDYDNDGWEDIYITYYGKNRLYHNQNGVFTEVGEKAGVAGSGKAWGTGCAFVDYDRDGRLDLIVANYVDFDLATAPAPGERPTCIWKGVPVMCGPRGLAGSKNILYHNQGGGRFEDVTTKAHIDRTDGHYAFSVSTFDFDEDGWPDIFVACDSTPSILYRNNHDGTFTDVAVTAGAAFNEDGREQAGMGSTIADYNGDGHLDIFKTNFSDDTSTLYKNNGDGTFTDATSAAGLGLYTQYLGWGTMFFDFDNDGWPDLILVNGHVYPEVDSQHLGSNYKEPRILYHNNGDGTFNDISASAGAGITAAASSRGLAVGDLWNDGRTSAVISNMNAAPSLLVNQLRNANHWIAIHTIGTKSNRDGIGARIRVKTATRIMVDEIRSGSSYISNSDMRVHFGLASASKIEWIEIGWPSGLTERFPNLPVDQIHTLKEGSGTPVEPGTKKPS